MVPGIAIDPKGTDPLAALSFGHRGRLSNDQIEVKECLKCPSCGFSDDYLGIFEEPFPMLRR